MQIMVGQAFSLSGPFQQPAGLADVSLFYKVLCKLTSGFVNWRRGPNSWIWRGD